MRLQETEDFFKHIKDPTTTLRLNVQQPTDTNLEQDYIDQILQKMLKSHLIYNIKWAFILNNGQIG